MRYLSTSSRQQKKRKPSFSPSPLFAAVQAMTRKHCNETRNNPTLLKAWEKVRPQPMRLADDTHMVEKPEEREKIDLYQHLKVEVQKDLEA